MKKVMAERYQALDGRLFDSPAAARQHEIDVFNAGVMVVEAQARALGKSRLKHGQYGSPEYESWSCMVQRCTNPRLKSYGLYGGRGIKVCDRWRTFENFLQDMGERPEGTSLDRFPNKDGNYEPGNCRWATRKEQGRNTNAVRLNEDLAERIRNDKRPDRVIAEELGVSRKTVNNVKNGRTWRKGV